MHARRRKIPLELAAEQLEIVVIERMKNFNRARRLFDPQHIARDDVAEFLHVEIGNSISGAHKLNFDFEIGREHNRTVRKRMGSNRNQLPAASA